MKEPAHSLVIAATLARECPQFHPYKVARLTDALLKFGRESARLAEADCNRPLTPREVRATDTLAARISACLVEFGVPSPERWRIHTEGAPRGVTLKLGLPSDAENDDLLPIDC